MKTETVYFGDCLKHLKQWVEWNKSLYAMAPSLADLIYLDPPWNSKTNYNVLFGQSKADLADCSTAQETAFTDMWQWGSKEVENRTNKICDDIHHPAHKSIRGAYECLGPSGMLAYLSYMAERLALLRMMLKPTGSIYLHCDPTMSHYLKMVMDDIFGANNFRNEITWKRTVSDQKGSQHAPKSWGNNTDIIFFYTKSDNYKLKPYRPLTEEERKKKFNKTDEKGRVYTRSPLWSSPRMGSRPTLCYEWKGFRNPHPSGWRLAKDRLEEEFRKGNVVIREDGKLERRQYPEDYPGWKPGNFWGDILPPKGKEEKDKYPTQKPLKLLERIIKASTEEGDVVLDPFCGCGTAVVAAEMLNRRFVGIDISLYSVETVTANRLVNEARLPEEKIKILGIPGDLESAKFLAKQDPFAFETFAVEACHPGMVANKSQRRDKGIDGRGMLLHPVKEKGKKKQMVLAQVKAGKPTPEQVRAFSTVIKDTPGAVAGVFITVEKGDWTDDMRSIAYQQGTFKQEHSADEYERLQHWHIGQWWWKTPSKRFPRLPALADPLSGKEMTALRQTGFLTKQYGSG